MLRATLPTIIALNFQLLADSGLSFLALLAAWPSLFFAPSAWASAIDTGDKNVDCLKHELLWEWWHVSVPIILISADQFSRKVSRRLASPLEPLRCLFDFCPRELFFAGFPLVEKRKKIHESEKHESERCRLRNILQAIRDTKRAPDSTNCGRAARAVSSVDHSCEAAVAAKWDTSLDSWREFLHASGRSPCTDKRSTEERTDSFEFRCESRSPTLKSTILPGLRMPKTRALRPQVMTAQGPEEAEATEGDGSSTPAVGKEFEEPASSIEPNGGASCSRATRTDSLLPGPDNEANKIVSEQGNSTSRVLETVQSKSASAESLDGGDTAETVTVGSDALASDEGELVVETGLLHPQSSRSRPIITFVYGAGVDNRNHLSEGSDPPDCVCVGQLEYHPTVYSLEVDNSEAHADVVDSQPAELDKFREEHVELQSHSQKGRSGWSNSNFEKSMVYNDIAALSDSASGKSGLDATGKKFANVFSWIKDPMTYRHVISELELEDAELTQPLP